MSDQILMIQLYSNGDCLYATAVARQIKHDYPDCHLTWAIASFCKNIILNNPYIDEIMVVDTVPKNNVSAYRKFKKSILKKYQDGLYTKIFTINNIDTNLCYYDGSIRGNILRAYPRPITLPLQPVLRLFQQEKETVEKFVKDNCLNEYQQVILFEYAPQSGQSAITPEFAIDLAEKIVENNNYAIILSSPNPILHENKSIIDGSVLSLRETAYLSNFCTFLLGTSSGITWASTSDAGKILPMVQLLNPKTRWFNSVSVDFNRFNIPNKGVIELFDLNKDFIIQCVKLALIDFDEAYKMFYKPFPLHFKTTRSIVYNLLCYLEFKAIYTHILLNVNVYGMKYSLFKEIFIGLITFPFKLTRNLLFKRR